MDVKPAAEDLKLKREELVERIAAIKRDLRGGLDKDLADQAIQLENFEVLQRLLEQAVAELNQLDQAT